VLRELHFGSILLGVALVVVLAAAASGAVLASSRKNGADRESIVGRLERIWLVASLAVAIGLTLQPGPGGFGSPLPSILNPLSGLHWGDALANTILYLPVGFFAVAVWKSKPRPVVWATGLAFSVALVIELAQFVLPISRSAQFHDVVFNTLGGFIGALAGSLVVQAARRPKQRGSERSPGG
jgi:VanZ family protein